MNVFWFLLGVLALVFLFKGEPTLFDKLHESAMRSATQEQCK